MPRQAALGDGGGEMSYVAEQLAMQEREEAEREMALWMAATAIREGLRRGDPEAIELLDELTKEKT